MVTVLVLDCDDPEHTFWSPQELAHNLGVPLSRVSGWRKNGGGPQFQKWGKTVVYQVSKVDEWNKANTYSMTGIRAGDSSRGRR